MTPCPVFLRTEVRLAPAPPPLVVALERTGVRAHKCAVFLGCSHARATVSELGLVLGLQ